MDVSISDIRVEVDSDGKMKNVHTIHTMGNGDKYELLFEEESSGTRKLFSCLSVIIDCLKNGDILIADELDAKLHLSF